MAIILLIFGVLNILVCNGFDMEPPLKEIEIKTQNNHDIPIEDLRNKINKNNIIFREKRYSSYNGLNAKNNTFFNHNNIPRFNSTINRNTGNNWLNNNVTRNNNHTRCYGRNVTIRPKGNINLRSNRTSNNVTFNGKQWTYGPATNGYNTLPGSNRNRVSNTTSWFPYPGQNTSRPGYNLNNTRFSTKPGYNSSTRPPPGYSRPGNNIQPGYIPYPGFNRGYFAANNTTPKNFNIAPIPISGYRPNPGINGSIPTNNNITVPYTPGFNRGYFAANNTTPNNFNIAPIPITGYGPNPGINGLKPAINGFKPGFNGTMPISFNNTVPYNPGFNGTAMTCNRCRNIARNNSTINKQAATMDACVIICNDCPAGMKRVGGYCVPDIDPDDED